MTQFSSLWAIGKTLSGASTQGQSGPGRDSNKWMLGIPQSSSITEASPLECLMSYPRHSLGETYLFAEMKSAYFTTPTDWIR